MKSGLVKPTGGAAAGEKTGLWDQPNKFARAPGIEVGKSITIHGYQEFQIRDGVVSPLSLDAPLRRKRQLAAPYFSPEFLGGKTLLDIGANGGFFSFWACQAGASQVVALDMDEAYLGLIRKAQTHLGWKQIRPVNCRVQDWEEPADVVLAYAMIHWLYSCTANFGSLEAAVAKLAKLTGALLLVEWVAPEDPAIAFFKHTDWNADLAAGPYNLEAFEAALRGHFHKVEIVGATSPTRTLYAAWLQRKESTVHPALPLLAPVEQILYGRCLVTVNGIDHYSRIYATDAPDRVIKQATGDLAMHEAEVLSQLQGAHFPRVLASEQREGYSVLTLERIAGAKLAEAIPNVSANPKRLAAFMNECLAILDELRAARIQHRDIRIENFMVREGKPVLLDFGWSQIEGRPYEAPPCVGAEARVPSGPPCDTYSMGIVLQQLVPQNSKLFTPLLHLMLTPSLARNLSLATFVQVLRGLELPEQWEAPPVFAVPRPFEAVSENPSTALPAVKQPYLRRTWQRWQRSYRKRFGRAKAE